MNIARSLPTLAIALALAGAARAQDPHAGHVVHAPVPPARTEDDAKADPSAADHAGMEHAAMNHAAMERAGMDPSSGVHPAKAQETPAAAEADSRPPPGHVAPPPPSTAMHAMSATEMVEVMGMDDRAPWGMIAFDRFERAEDRAFAWSGRVDYGGDLDRLRLRSEGEHADGRIGHADLELLWSHAVAAYWDTQFGLRHDMGDGPDRSWLAFGVQGLAPYWFEVAATAYVGEQGRTALRFEVEYEALLTQRLVLQPRVEFNAYGRSDRAAGIGAGLSDATSGVRLRYEIRREFAPYVGIERRWRFGGTADAARAHGEAATDTQWVAGVRFWF